MNNRILLAQGSGGEESEKLIDSIFFKAFRNKYFQILEDAAVLPVASKIALTTDSFTVKPIFFSGGDIGKLAICGTTNDLAVMGAKPLYLTSAFIIEEGFLLADLQTIVSSMVSELKKNNAYIVTGDTKVVPKGAVDGVFINTAGVGSVMQEGLSASAISQGDVILVSGNIGDHGAHIYSQREGIDIESDLKSDCASVWPLVEKILKECKPHALRDATRGGLAAVLNEWARASDVAITLYEDEIPIDDSVRGICELLGFEAYHLACEGVFVMAIPKQQATCALDIMHSHPLGKNAKLIGELGTKHKAKVLLETALKTKRFLDAPPGVLLPRIC